MSLFFSLSLMFAVAAASGLVGAFALMKKMTLASDAISHVALPGLGIAILLKINPIIGGAAAIIIGALLIWVLERKTKIATETVIGVVFSASLAIGSLITPSEELLEVLFGGFGAVTFSEWIIGLLAALLIFFLILSLKEKFALSLVSQDLARTIGLNTSRLNLIFLLIFAVNVILGLKFLGVLLMGSLIIIPAAISKNLSWNLNSDLFLSSLLALISVAAGFLFSAVFDLELGPAIISVSSVFFLISIFFKK